MPELTAAGIAATATIGPDPNAPADAAPVVRPWVNITVTVVDETGRVTPVPGYLAADDAAMIGAAIVTAAVEARTDTLVYNIVAELGDAVLAKALLAAIRDARHLVPDQPPAPPDPGTPR